MQILSGRRHRVEELAFSHCGRWLAAAGSGGGLHLWDTHDPGAEPRHVPVRPAYRRAPVLTFRPDGRLFYAAGYSWYVLDPGGGRPTRVAPNRHWAATVSADGTRIVRSRDWSPLRTYRVTADGVTGGPSVPVPGTYFAHAAFTPDGTAFAVEEVVGALHLPSPRRVTVRAADTGEQLAALAPAFTARPMWVAREYRFSPDGSRLVGRCEAVLARWAVADPDRPPVVVRNPAGREFLALAFHPDGSLLTVDDGRLVRVWDAGTLTPGRAVEWNVGKLYAVAVSPDGARAAVGSHTGKVLVWDWD
jgi:WD40 repeat protein